MSSAIEWTDETWNPTVGCSRVSPGCDSCYAIRVAARGMSDAHRGLTKDGDWTGEVRCLPERLDTPLRWRRPRRVFVDSMSDLFHPSVPDEFIGSVWNTMALTPWHTYQVLTKRPRRMAELLSKWAADGWHWRRSDLVWCGPVPGPLPNVWLGTSVEDQHQADRRIPHLLAAPAAVRFLSCEPLLGPVSLRWAKWHDYWPDGWRERGEVQNHLDGARRLDWVIVGGESGPRARPMHPAWARDLRDECVEAGVPFHFKQWGEYGCAPGGVALARTDPRTVLLDPTTGKHRAPSEALPSPECCAMFRVGKKAAGRVLDGRTWDEFPVNA